MAASTARAASQAASAKRKTQSAPAPRLIAGKELGDTKARILDAAFRCLATEGYAALSIREIGKAAGVNSALIGYHFGGKDQLVLEVLDAANERLLARQKEVYRGPQGFAEKWAEARRFYESDLASGFVRVQAELMAAGYSNPWLREKVAARVWAWGDLIEGSAREALDELASAGISVPAPLTPEVIATWIGFFWLGMEAADLLGGGPRGWSNAAALDAMHKLLESLDALAGKRARQASAGRGKRK